MQVPHLAEELIPHASTPKFPCTTVKIEDMAPAITKTLAQPNKQKILMARVFKMDEVGLMELFFDFWTSMLQNSETINLHSFKLPGLQYFATAALAN